MAAMAMVLFVTSSMIAPSPGYGALRHFVHDSVVPLYFKVEIWIVLTWEVWKHLTTIAVIIETSRSAHPFGAFDS